ncbi:MAG: NAD-dependent epimerase/dehydratase family protein [Sphingomonadales bacterium]
MSVNPTRKKNTVALTGATGFIGPYLIKALKASGYHVRALTRRPQPEQTGVDWVKGRLDDPEAIRNLVQNAVHVVHAAGAIKARNKPDFFQINCDACTFIARAAKAARVQSFVLMSSLAARAPELSDYAASKAAGEAAIAQILGNDIPWVALRPPAVFGPGDTETLKIFKAIKSGFAPLISPHARASWIYADDLAQATVAALTEQNAFYQILPLDDGSGGYLVRESHQLVADLLDRKLRIVRIPPPLLSFIGLMNEGLSSVTRRTPMLTRGKARELSHPDWGISEPGFAEKSDWEPRTSLAEGLRISLNWYREKGLL